MTTYGGRLEARFNLPAGVTISVTNSGGSGTVVTVAADTYSPSSLCAYLAGALQAQRPPSAGAWSVALSVGRGGTGLVRISISSGTFAITWTSTLLRDVLGFGANIATTAIATAPTQARGLWMPDCPHILDLEAGMAPLETDTRSSESPSGFVLTLKSAERIAHKGLTFTHVPRARIREAAAVAAGITKASLEQWLSDTQWGRGHSWFRVGSSFDAYWDDNGTDALVGVDVNAGAGPALGWSFSPAIASHADLMKRAVENFDGYWTLTFPRLVSEG